MALLVFSTFAEQDFDDIWNYIAEDNTHNASHFLRQLHQTCELLSQNPLMGVARMDLSHSLRAFPTGNYIIFYQRIPHGIEVVRVLHAGRDIPALF
jgi:toxin ParE1/3/4